MAKKRRKLNKDFEKKIYSSKKNVELVLAKIYDIDDEDIQKEYMSAFNEVVYSYDQLKNDYELIGLGWVYYPLKIKLLSPLLRLVYRYWAKYRLQITGRSNIEKLCTSKCEQ